MRDQLDRCPLEGTETSDILLDYAAGRLEGEKVVALERHMDSCGKCAAFRGSQSAIWDALDAWQAPPVSQDFNRRLWQRIEAAEAQKPWYAQLGGAIRFGSWKAAIPLAAAALVLVAGLVLDHPRTKTAPPATAAAPSVSVTEADQLEQTLDDVQLLNQLDATAGMDKPAAKPL
jgi:anti-sigma factor RsiW